MNSCVVEWLILNGDHKLLGKPHVVCVYVKAIDGVIMLVLLIRIHCPKFKPNKLLNFMLSLGYLCIVNSFWFLRIILNFFLVYGDSVDKSKSQAYCGYLSLKVGLINIELFW